MSAEVLVILLTVTAAAIMICAVLTRELAKNHKNTISAIDERLRAIQRQQLAMKDAEVIDLDFDGTEDVFQPFDDD